MSEQETVISKEACAGLDTKWEIVDIYRESQWTQDSASGSPVITYAAEDTVLSRTTCWVRPAKKLFTHSKMLHNGVWEIIDGWVLCRMLYLNPTEWHLSGSDCLVP